MMTVYAKMITGRSNLTEAELISAARKGDLEAFNQLVLSYQDRIYNLVRRILWDQDLAEDITQNTFLTAYLSLSHFRNGSFRSWLYRIATNACYDELRRRKRHPLLSLEHEDDAEERRLPLYDYSGKILEPEKSYEKSETEQAIQRALQQLDADRRAVVVLVDLQDFDYREVADILGVPIGTVKSRLARARMQLRELLSTIER